MAGGLDTDLNKVERLVNQWNEERKCNDTENLKHLLTIKDKVKSNINKQAWAGLYLTVPSVCQYLEAVVERHQSNSVTKGMTKDVKSLMR